MSFFRLSSFNQTSSIFYRTRFVIPFAVAIATIFCSTASQAQEPVDLADVVRPHHHLVMVHKDGGLHYIMTNIKQAEFLGLQVFTALGTDLNTVQHCVIIPTTTPGGYGYIVAQDDEARLGSPAGSAGSIFVTRTRDRKN